MSSIRTMAIPVLLTLIWAVVAGYTISELSRLPVSRAGRKVSFVKRRATSAGIVGAAVNERAACRPRALP